MKEASVSVRVRVFSEDTEKNRVSCLALALHSHSVFVPGAGIEPAQPCGHWFLRPARLPIPPSGQIFWQIIFKRTYHSFTNIQIK